MNIDDVAPLADIFGMPWPDINDESLLVLQSSFGNFGSDVEDLGYPVATLLHELSQSNSSQAIDSLSVHWQEIQSRFLSPFCDICQQIARYTGDAYDVVRGFKAAIAGVIDLEVGAAALSGGVDAIAALVDRQALRHELRKLSEGVMDDVLRRLQSDVLGLISAAVDDLAHLASQAIELPETQGILSITQDVLVVGASGGPTELFSSIAGSLHITEQTLETRAAAIVNVYETCDADAGKLGSALAELARPAAVPGESDSTIRTYLLTFFEDVIRQVSESALTTCRALLEHQSGLVSLIGDQMSQVDQTLAVSAHPIAGSAALQAAGGAALLTGGTAVASWNEGSDSGSSSIALGVPGSIDRAPAMPTHVVEGVAADASPETAMEVQQSLAWFQERMANKSMEQYAFACEHAVEVATGHPDGLGYYWASDHYAAVAALPNSSPYALHPPSDPAPPGAIVYFHWYGTVNGVPGNYGHVGLSEGNGQFIGTTGNGDDIGVKPLSAWGSDYLGWSYPTPPGVKP